MLFRSNGLHCCRENVRTAAAPTGPLLRARFALLGSRDRPGEPRMSGHSQFQLLRQRRFLPFFATQCFGAFNDNVYRQAIIKSEEHTSELQSLMRISYAVSCLKKNNHTN